ncbi:MAG: radical SAM protein [Planctomycetia bacterium]|nr:radical SAM protein [Planctomycetia bacterium]
MAFQFFDTGLRESVLGLLLPEVQLPGQYIGGEFGQTVKAAESVEGRFCLAFPDTYSIGMSNYGLGLLYAIMNRKANWSCERVFCPWPDFARQLESAQLPLYSLETFTPLYVFDLLGFTLQYELSYTNVLTMLDAGGIPLHREMRAPGDPLVIAGGPAVFNPEPMSDFIDVFVVGDGEEAIGEISAFWLDIKKRMNVPRLSQTSGGTPVVSDRDRGMFSVCGPASAEAVALRREMLLEVARKFPWAYVPEFYDVSYDEQGRARRPRPRVDGVPETISPAIIRDLDLWPPSTTPIIPLVESVQDRISVEVMRGCPQKCRFCQSSPIKRPLRFRSVEQITQLARDAAVNTGVSDITLLSLSTSEYPWFDELMKSLSDAVCPLGVSLAVPSLRVNHQLSDVVTKLSTQRSSSLTMAPEAARDGMRKRLAKRVTNDDLMNGCRGAFENGFARIKMYFMCGLPGETEDDLDGIIELSEQIARLGKEVRGRWPVVVANVSNFVPKPHTPLQWEGMALPEYLRGAHTRLKRSRRPAAVDVKYHELATSLLEGLLARGDRRVGRIIESAWRKGAKLDAWSDHHRNELWQEAIQESGLDTDLIVHGHYSTSDELPWDHIQIWAGREKLLREYERSQTANESGGC